MEIRPRTAATTLDRVIVCLVLIGIVFLAGYNIGLSKGADMAIPHDSTHLQAPIVDSPVRFFTTRSDTLQGGIVVEVVEDMIWHEATLIITRYGNELASAIIDH